MDVDQAAALREKFLPEQIGKLPRITCANCRDSRSKVCEQHSKVKCDECDNYMTTAHIHLDFVGHAGVTDRLLKVDPEWTWEPMAVDPATGAPLKADGGLWIRLTVCGMTRPGWGDGANVKEMIGDAIRNAAMRFGVALDLWAKQDLHADPPDAPAKPEIVNDIRDRLKALPDPFGRNGRTEYRQNFGSPDDLTESKAPLALVLVTKWEQEARKAAEGDALLTNDQPAYDEALADDPVESSAPKAARRALAEAEARAEAIGAG